MKIFKKIIVAVLLIVCVLTLCSCDELDDLRKVHAVFGSEKMDTVIFDGATYKEITDNIINTDLNEGININLTKADVPVLITMYINGSTYINSDETIIVDYRYRDEYDADNYKHIYAREDVYDAVLKELKAQTPVYTRFAVHGVDDDFNLKQYFFTDAQSQTLKDILSRPPYKKEDIKTIKDEVGIISLTELGVYCSYEYTVSKYTDGSYEVCKYGEADTFHYAVTDAEAKIIAQLFDTPRWHG